MVSHSIRRSQSSVSFFIWFFLLLWWFDPTLYGRSLGAVAQALSLSTTSSSSRSTRVYFDSSNALHRDLRYHPEQPERITATIRALCRDRLLHDKAPFLELIDVADEPQDLLMQDGTSSSVSIQGHPFTREELDHAKHVLGQTHSTDFIARLERQCQEALQRRQEQGKEDLLGHMGYIDGGDTYWTTYSFAVCLRATATWIRALDQLLLDQQHQQQQQQQQPPHDSPPQQRIPTAMALTRPPGHHAMQQDSNGFCLVNFAAATAIHALSVLNDAAAQPTDKETIRISILDWDVHYGQGKTSCTLWTMPQSRRVGFVRPGS